MWKTSQPKRRLKIKMTKETTVSILNILKNASTLLKNIIKDTLKYFKLLAKIFNLKKVMISTAVPVLLVSMACTTFSLPSLKKITKQQLKKWKTC